MSRCISSKGIIISIRGSGKIEKQEKIAMMEKTVDHSENLIYLKKVEGQLRGIQKMIEEGKYCIDILAQLHAAVGALLSIEDKILKKHFENCVVTACKTNSRLEREKKIEEILNLISKFRK